MKKITDLLGSVSIPGMRKLFMIMKLTSFFLLISVISVLAGKTYSQTKLLTLNFEKTSVKEVLSKIEDQSEFYFMYSEKIIDVNREVSVNIENQKIETVLNTLFTGTDVNYLVKDRIIVLTNPEVFDNNAAQVAFQQKTVSGKVTDTNNQPLPGVTVVIKGSTQGTVTDGDGIYTISNIPDNATLHFSFVGMKAQDVLIGNQTTINVSMEEETIGLEEVVAIGYGTQKRSNLTSSISKITDEAMKDRPIMSVGEALQGQLAGVRSQASGGGVPGRDLTIRIRGMNTINGDASPLYVIDGIPRENMSDLNPNDIATIQILKDAAATSIYGSRGGNGVVLIETKRGKGRPTITFDAYYGLSTAEKKIELMSGEEWVAYNIFRRNLNHLRAGGSLSDPMSSRAAGNQIPDYWTTTTDFTDWQDAVLQTGPIQNYQFSASAESDIGNIYFSAGYLDQEGILVYSYYNRKNVRLNGTINAGEKLKFGINLTASHSDRDDSDVDGGANGAGKESSLHHAVMLTPLMGLNQGTRDWGFPSNLGTTYPNPVEQQRLTTDRHLNLRVGANIWGEYNIIDGMKFRTQYGYNHDGYTYEFFQPGNVTYNNGYVTLGNSNASTNGEWTFQNTLEYNKLLGGHNVNLLIGQSIHEQNYFYLGATASGWPYESIETLNVATTPTRATTSRSTYTTASFFGRVNYDYLEKYLLSASLRYDGSSRFGSNTKWGYFPSVSVGWKINEESFLQNAEWISLLKLRAAIGTSGNDRIGNYAYMSLLNINNTSWGDGVASGVAPNRLPNENLQWEATQTLDIGLDFSAFNNRMQLNFDIYRNKTSNLLFSVPVPYSTGYSSYTTNIGSVENRGWEIDLTSYNMRGGEFDWTTNLNLSRNRNEVLDMGDIDQFIQGSWDAQFITKVGGPVSQFYAYKTNGVLMSNDFDAVGKALVPTLAGQREGNVKYVDQNNDGIINTEDYVEMGTNLPDLIYGLNNRFSWKNIDLNILIQGQYGGEVLFLGARQVDNGGGNINTTKRWLRFYKEDYIALYGENPIPVDYAEKYGIDFSWDGRTNNPVGTNNNNDDRRIYDASYLRIKSITLGYDIPNRLFTNSIIRGLRCYASVDNLIIFDDYPGYTVETNSFGNETTRMGVDYSTYPLSRRFVFGVNLIF